MLHNKSFVTFERNFQVMIKRILFANKKNSNDRYYTINSLKKMVSDYNREVLRVGEFYGSFKDSEDFHEYLDVPLNVRDIAFIVKELEVRGSFLVANIELLETPRGKELKKMMNKISFRPISWGFVKEDGAVEIERLVSINAIYKTTDLWGE